MIGRQDRRQQEMFVPGNLEALVPDDHILKRVDRVLDTSWLREEVASCYCGDNGRPGIDPEAMSTPLCAKVAGFSLHAARVVDASDRAGLERLCRYGLRAPFSQERLRLREDGRVVYQLRRPWPNAAGATCLVLEPLELLRRLAALVPAPYTNLVRYPCVCLLPSPTSLRFRSCRADVQARMT